MVLAGSPAEVAALEDFQAELARILAGEGLPVTDDAPAPAVIAVDDGDGEIPAAVMPAESVPVAPTESESASESMPVGRKKGSAGAAAVRYHPTIQDLPRDERPRERLRLYGPRQLNNAELIALLLRSGRAGENAVSMAMRVIAEFEGLGGLARAGYAELCEQHGVNDAKSCAILAALELGRRIASLAPEERAQISCPGDAANLVSAEMSLLAQENLVALLLNTRNQVVARRTIYIGTVNSSAVRPAEVLRPAVRENAPSIIVVHNHPSGDPTPSPEDVAVTRDLIAAGKLLGIELLDHLVIGSGGRFASLKERGLGFDGV